MMLEPGGPSKARRALAIAPYVAVVGSRGSSRTARSATGPASSGYYVDPSRRRFAKSRSSRRMRLSALLLGQLSLPSSDVSASRCRRSREVTIVASAIAVRARSSQGRSGRLVRRDPVLRFFVLGALLTALPMLAVVPSDRLLLLMGFGAFGIART